MVLNKLERNSMTKLFKLLLSILIILISLSEAQATVWKCSTKDGSRDFPIIDPRSTADGKEYTAILEALEISDEEYKELGVSCISEVRKAKTQAPEKTIKKNNNPVAQTPVKKIAKPQSQTSSVKSNAQLDTDGLNYFNSLKSIYLGDFESVEFTKESVDMIGIIAGYRGAFSDICKDALPKNKVEITKDVCDREEWQENRFGEIPNSRHCVSNHKEGTGKYADPEINNLKNSLDDAKYAGAKNIIEAITNPNIIRDLADQADAARWGSKAMYGLLTKNGCASKATKLFQANLIRFGRGREPIVTAGLEPIKDIVTEYQSPVFDSRALWCGHNNCDYKMPLMDMFKTVDQPKGPMVLTCYYQKQIPGKSHEFGFWYKVPPANIQELLTEDKKGNSIRTEDKNDNTGRLRWLGTQSAQKCPETMQKAKELRRAALKETGYPDE